MPKSVNQVFLIGRLTRDVELKSTTTGKNVASFSLAVDKATGEGADFFDCVAWEKTADLLQQYTSKGSKIHVQGNLQQRSWDDKDGNKRNKVEITVRDVTFLDSKPQGQTNTPPPATENVGGDPINLDDIPF